MPDAISQTQLWLSNYWATCSPKVTAEDRKFLSHSSRAVLTNGAQSAKILFMNSLPPSAAATGVICATKSSTLRSLDETQEFSMKALILLEAVN